MQKLYSVNEVAEILGVTNRTVYRYIDKGTLQSNKTPTGIYRITESALNTFVNGGESTSNSQVSDNLK